jgi:hypothetical protein
VSGADGGTDRPGSAWLVIRECRGFDTGILLSSCSRICTPVAAAAPNASSHRTYQCVYRLAIASRKGACHADSHCGVGYPSPSQRSSWTSPPGDASLQTRWLCGQVQAVAGRPLLRITCSPEALAPSAARRENMVKATGAPRVCATL